MRAGTAPRRRTAGQGAGRRGRAHPPPSQDGGRAPGRRRGSGLSSSPPALPCRCLATRGVTVPGGCLALPADPAPQKHAGSAQNTDARPGDTHPSYLAQSWSLPSRALTSQSPERLRKVSGCAELPARRLWHGRGGGRCPPAPESILAR